MIAYLEGRLELLNEDVAVVDVGGVGYRVFISPTTAARLPGRGESARLHTLTYMRENSIELYGFATRSERDLFETLLSVSGVGSRLGLRILASVSVGDFRVAVSSEDYSLLTTISGIGKKTAQRLVLELREKLGDDFFERYRNAGEAEAGSSGEGLESDGVLALLNLGYSRREAVRAVDRALRMLQRDGEGFSLSELIQQSLKYVE